MEHEIYSTLMVSTGHLSATILNKLDPQWRKGFLNNQTVSIKGSALDLLDRTSSGWRLYIPYEDGQEATERWLDNIRPIGEELVNLIQLAIAHRCRYLEFHLDGPMLEGFPIYDW